MSAVTTRARPGARHRQGSAVRRAAITVAGCAALLTTSCASTGTTGNEASSSPAASLFEVQRGGTPAFTAGRSGEDPVTAGRSSPDFPVTVHRTGGINAIDEQVTMSLDGHLKVTTTRIMRRVCTLTPEHRYLIALLTTVPLADGGQTASPTPNPPVDDDASPVSTVITDRLGRHLDLRAQWTGAVATGLNALIDDVTLTHPDMTSCT